MLSCTVCSQFFLVSTTEFTPFHAVWFSSQNILLASSKALLLTSQWHHQKLTSGIHVMDRCNIYRQLSKAMIQGVRQHANDCMTLGWRWQCHKQYPQVILAPLPLYLCLPSIMVSVSGDHSFLLICGRTWRCLLNINWLCGWWSFCPHYMRILTELSNKHKPGGYFVLQTHLYNFAQQEASNASISGKHLRKLCKKGRILTYARNNSDSQFIWHVNAGSQQRICGGVRSLINKTQANRDTSEEA
jgi:hypothetical protein